jgi:hypothetical protein
MKVVCIYNENFESYLTIDKSYDVIEERSLNYKIIDNDGDEFWYFAEWFKPLSEMRNEKINKLLE